LLHVCFLVGRLHDAARGTSVDNTDTGTTSCKEYRGLILQIMVILAARGTSADNSDPDIDPNAKIPLLVFFARLTHHTHFTPFTRVLYSLYSCSLLPLLVFFTHHTRFTPFTSVLYSLYSYSLLTLLVFFTHCTHFSHILYSRAMSVHAQFKRDQLVQAADGVEMWHQVPILTQ